MALLHYILRKLYGDLHVMLQFFTTMVSFQLLSLKFFLMVGHPIEKTLEVAEKVWAEVFYYLALPAMKVLSGAGYKEEGSTSAPVDETMESPQPPPVAALVCKADSQVAAPAMRFSG